MRKFEYRPPRLRSNLRVEFLLPDRTLHGWCINISDSGIRVTLDAKAPIGSTGSLILNHPQCSFTIEAVVSHRQIITGEVGLSFIFHTPQERELARQFLNFTTEYS